MPPSGDQPSRFVILRQADQAVVGLLVALALGLLAAYWVAHEGHHGRLIEIEGATPLTAKFQVDLNSADWPELAQLPNVGETLARRIIAHRQQFGPYMSHEDLTRVPGIGPKTLEKILEYLKPMDAAIVADSPPGPLGG